MLLSNPQSSAALAALGPILANLSATANQAISMNSAQAQISSLSPVSKHSGSVSTTFSNTKTSTKLTTSVTKRGTAAPPVHKSASEDDSDNENTQHLTEPAANENEQSDTMAVEDGDLAAQAAQSDDELVQSASQSQEELVPSDDGAELSELEDGSIHLEDK